MSPKRADHSGIARDTVRMRHSERKLRPELERQVFIAAELHRGDFFRNELRTAAGAFAVAPIAAAVSIASSIRAGGGGSL